MTTVLERRSAHAKARLDRVGTVTMPQKPAARPARRKTRAARYRSQHHDMQSDFPRGVARCRSGKLTRTLLHRCGGRAIHLYAFRRRPRRLTRNNWRDNYRNNSCHAASRQSNRLAANKHRSTVPDVTAVTAILIKPATAVETTGIGRSVDRSDFGLRFLAAMVILGRVRLPCSLTQTLPCRVVPDLSTASRACATKRLSGIVNQTLPNGDGLQIYAVPVHNARRHLSAWHG